LVVEHRGKSSGGQSSAAAESQRRLDYYEGRAQLLKKDFTAAEASFARGMQGADDDSAQVCREYRILALARMGKALTAYEQIPPRSSTYDQLARLFAREKNVAELKALVETHAKNVPDDPTIGLWRAEIHWMQQDYSHVITSLLDRRTSILSDELNRGRFEDRLIRSLVRTKRFEEAWREAKASTRRDGDPWFELVVACSQPNAEATERLLSACVDRGYRTEDFYADVDIGHALKSEVLKSLRQKYPAPGDAEAKSRATPAES
jgi:hypothetical protein